jgi:SNF2 family DNA or RNA helicase
LNKRKDFLFDYGISNSKSLRREWEETSVITLKLGRRLNKAKPSPSIGDYLTPFILREADEDFLYSYQKEGVEWLFNHSKCILADDMGLGKTVQSIRALQRLFRSNSIRKVIILCPKSVTHSWIEELAKWSPELTLFCSTSKDYAMNDPAFCHIHLMHYELYQNSYQNIDWERVLLITDEAHRLRKDTSGIHQIIKQATPDYWWMLSGTPIENRSSDLVTLLSLLAPSKFSADEKVYFDSDLRHRATNYVLRRTKKQVANDLPKLHELVVRLDLSKEQADRYKKVVSGIAFGKNSALAKFGKLREICDFDRETGKSSKVEKAIELIQEILSKNEKVVVFSYLLEPISLLKEKLKSMKLDYQVAIIDGSLSLEERSGIAYSFQNESSPTILLASLRAAGEGLTLTKANHAIFINRWWNPSLNNQGRDRIYRIGQHKECYCHYLQANASVENRLEFLLKEKGKSFDAIIEKLSVVGGEDPDIELIVNEIME